MADFVAVIRRAVDGLSDNNAEMRQKVYDKARGAVRRQLESMNPRPSDDLMKRQLDKLEAAIESVEIDHAEALPVEEVAPEPIEEIAPVAAVEPEPVVEDPGPAGEAVEEQAAVEEERYDAPPAVADVSEPEEPVEAETHAYQPEAYHDEPVADEPAPEPVEDHREDAFTEGAPVDEPVAYIEPALETEPEPQIVEARSEPSWQVEATPADDYVPSWQEPEAERQSAAMPAAVETAEAFDPAPHHDYEVHDAQVPEAEPVADARLPDVDAQWEWHEQPSLETPAEKSVPAAQEPDLLAWEWPQDKGADVKSVESQPEKSAHAGSWSDLDTLLGTTPAAVATAAAASQANVAGDASSSAAASSISTADTARAPQRSFRTEPRKSRLNLGALAATVALLAVVGGAGAAYWFNRDAVNGWVGNLVASVSGSANDDTPVETAEGTRGVSAETPPAETAQTSQDNTAGGTEVAAVTPSSGGKFTQRLLADGTEVDNGPAQALDGTAEEGKSVAAQTTESASAAVGAGTPATGGEAAATATDGTAQTPGGATAAGTDTQTTAAGGEQAAAIGVTQKMFLYEERLGQTSPTAIEGTVAWSSGEESPGGDAKPEPVVRAQINVPSKGLTALVTFRRNADNSLPASHIIELVFSLPENFEGGGIESVQRVAMKRTEQDRGDALIAVPAKITDDFHMIALNDFPEAIAKNTELLRTRPWIDIPITYRNGRRALLTLDKGTAGSEAFDKVMRAWAAAGSSQ
ncbi:hypothetical protein MNR02_03700 [Shinella sp. H4-D48]|uniref:hypothetical protein n=1 Tax=Shinella sp. H4-D48 TaxID=2925841 RepID=UPI001F52E4F1|nr:hypothetical protein [Shinella sp. H4-D48]UNK38824.1 hypothetical protein MNR02_03700 [Shinella sp. H4-D48]